MTPDSLKTGYRRPPLPSPPVIDVPPYAVPQSGRSRLLFFLVLALLGGVAWAFRETVKTAAASVELSYHQAFPSGASPEVPLQIIAKKPEASAPGLKSVTTEVLKNQAALSSPTEAQLELKSSGPPAGASWPSFVAIRGTPQVTVVAEDSEARKFVYRTENYEFQADAPIGADAVREFSRVFEATFQANCLLPLNYRPSPEQGRERFTARLFSTDAAYFAAGGIPGSAGSYSRNQAALLVPVSSIGMKMVNGRMQTDRTEATETLVHEITHQMMSRWLPRVPVWFAEGTADYMAMADYVHGRFVLNQMENRLRQYVKRRQPDEPVPLMLSIPELMAIPPERWSSSISKKSPIPRQNYSSATLLVYYFYHLDGKGDAAAVKAYLQAIEDGVPEKTATEKHLLHGRTVTELEADVLNAYTQRHLKLSITERGGKRWAPLPAVATAQAPSKR